MKKTLYILLICLHSQLALSQLGLGQWRDHFPYHDATMIVEARNKIFCSTSYALFYYNKDDGSINKLSKVNGLSDIKPSALAYSKAYDILLVAYQNANLDIIHKNDIINIDDIKNKAIQGDKKIYSININKGLAYLSTGFGIVVLDIERQEIKETYYIGDNASELVVYETLIFNGYIYAATEQGIYYADINSSQLVNYKEWTRIDASDLPVGKYNSIASINSQILVNFVDENTSKTTVYRYKNSTWSDIYSSQDYTKRLRANSDNLFIIDKNAILILNKNLTIDKTINNYQPEKAEPNDCVKSQDGSIYIADAGLGLIRYNQESFKIFWVNSPWYNNVVDIDTKDDKVCVAGGGRNSYWGSLWQPAQMYEFSNEQWKSNIYWKLPLRDIVKVVINPYNTKQVYAASWGAGLLLFENDQLSKVYNTTNSTLESAIAGKAYINVGGIAIDNNRNVYVTNSLVEAPISVKTPEGKWYNYKYSAISRYERVGDIINTRYGHNWVQLGRSGGIFAFDDNNTLNDITDDKTRLFSLFDVNGNVETNDVLSMAEDNDGVIWVGTNQGVLTYFNPQNVFSGENFYADRIKVVDTSADTLVQYLLVKEKITAIAVDGANRKWFGTENSGAFLMSEDGREEIFHFTAENSKLISNTITSIAVQENTGEVFFGTNEGIVSFKGSSTKGKENFANAYIYPNPVRETYTGNITITGLVTNVNVKITDISGQLVYETTAMGGQAVWNGKNYSGQRVRTGVYLVFCTDEQGERTKVLKLLVIN